MPPIDTRDYYRDRSWQNRPPPPPQARQQRPPQSPPPPRRPQSPPPPRPRRREGGGAGWLPCALLTFAAGAVVGVLFVFPLLPEAQAGQVAELQQVVAGWFE